MKRVASRAMTLACLLASPSAFASDAARLFDEGVKLLDAQRFAEACPKLEESQKLEPAAGTQLNLAACYEKSGRRALALKTFREAGRAARARGRADWQKVADDHVRDLSASLPRLDVQRGATGAEDEIIVDGTLLTEAELAAGTFVDPGTHVVVARAPGRVPFSTTVSVKTTTVIAIPALEPEGAKKPEGAESRSEDEGGARRTIAIAAMGAGGAALIFGGASAFVAKGALDDAKDACLSYPTQCAPGASAPNDRAKTWSSISTVSFVAGGVLAAGGVALYLLWPSSRHGVALGTNGTQAFVRGRF